MVYITTRQYATANPNKFCQQHIIEMYFFFVTVVAALRHVKTLLIFLEDILKYLVNVGKCLFIILMLNQNIWNFEGPVYALSK